MADSQSTLNSARLAFYDNRPTAFLTQTVAQSIPNNAFTAITFGAATNDNWSGWSAGSPSRYTVQVAGVYAISGIVPWAVNGNGNRAANISLTGSTLVGSQYQTVPNVSTDFTCVQTPIVYVRAAVGDYFILNAYQGAGVALNTASSGSLTCSFSVELVRF